MGVEYYRNEVPEFPKGNVNLVDYALELITFEYSTNFWKDLLIKIHLETLKIQNSDPYRVWGC